MKSAHQTQIRMECVTLFLGIVHAERARTNVPERPHFVEKRVNQVPRRHQRKKTMPIVKYVNTLFNFISVNTISFKFNSVLGVITFSN